MLNFLVEHEGASFSGRVAAEVLPGPMQEELAVLTGALRAARCPVHGDPRGTAHVGLRPRIVTVDDSCCDVFSASVASLVEATFSKEANPRT